MHPASARTHALTSVRRAIIVFHVCVVIGLPPWSHALISTPHNSRNTHARVPEHGLGGDRTYPGHSAHLTSFPRPLTAHTSLSGPTRVVQSPCSLPSCLLPRVTTAPSACDAACVLSSPTLSCSPAGWW